MVMLKNISMLQRLLTPGLCLGDSDKPLIEDDFKQNSLSHFCFYTVSEIHIVKSGGDLNKKAVSSQLIRELTTLLSAANANQWEIALLAEGSDQQHTLSIGFAVNDANSVSEDASVFKSLLQGVFPGAKLAKKVTAKARGFRYGGLALGLPVLDSTSEISETFELANILKALPDKQYQLLFHAVPVAPSDTQRRLQKAWELQDECNRVAKTTVSEQDSTQETEQISKVDNIIKTFMSGAFGGDVSSSSSQAKTIMKGLSYEQRNSTAESLGELMKFYADRFSEGYTTGMWDTTVSFSSNTEVTSKIIGGLLSGEMARHNRDFRPPQISYHKLETDKGLLLRKFSGREQDLFGPTNASWLNTKELASVICFPPEPVPGYDISEVPILSIDTESPYSEDEDETSIELGKACYLQREIGHAIALTKRDLGKHLFVTGTTGSGKTHTIKQILSNADLPFIVLEFAKREYRPLLSLDGNEDWLTVYTPGDATIAPFVINPLFVLPDVPVLTHIDTLKALFNASFGLYGPMPAILEQCLYSLYQKKGWNLTLGTHPLLCDKNGDVVPSRYTSDSFSHLFPVLPELLSEIENYLELSQYQGELKGNITAALCTRIRSLCVGSKGALFCSSHGLDMQDLLSRRVIFELEGLASDDDKAFFAGLMLGYISQYRQQNAPGRSIAGEHLDNTVKHLLVLEEAHRLLKNGGNNQQGEMSADPRQQAIEFFSNMLSELRATGQGVVVAEQIPSKILPDVIKNTNTKIVHRLVAKDDQALLSSSLSIDVNDMGYLNNLNTGEALIHREGMTKSLKIKVNAGDSLSMIGDYKLRRLHQKNNATDDNNLQLSKDNLVELKRSGFKLLISLLLGDLDRPAVESSVPRLIALSLQSCRDIYSQQNGNDVLESWLVREITGLLSNGVFSVTRDLSEGVFKLTKDLMKDDSSDAYAQWKSSIALSWGEDLVVGTERRLTESLYALYQHRISSKELKIESITSTMIETDASCFFLIADSPIKSNVVNSIVDRFKLDTGLHGGGRHD